MRADRFTPEVLAVLRSFGEHGVKALLVGGHAVAVHGYERPAADVDLWIETSATNAAKIWSALEGLGHAGLGGVVDRAALSRAGGDLSVGEPWIGLDLCRRMGSLELETCWSRGRTVWLEAEGQPVIIDVISLDDLVALKRELGRPKDLRDLAGLGLAE